MDSPTVEVRLIQDLRFDDLLDDVLQGDDAHHLVEGVALPLVVHSLHDGQVGFTWEQVEMTFTTFSLFFPF